MTLSSVSPTSQPSYGDGYSPPRSNEERPHTPSARGDANESPADSLMAGFEAELASPVPPESARFATVIKADLAGLSDVEHRRNAEPPREPSAAEVLGSLSSLLASVSGHDASGAREAANALQFELFSGASAMRAASLAAEDAAGRMLDDLRALIRAARLGDTGVAESSARALARDLQNALLGVSMRASLLERRARRRMVPRAAAMGQSSSLVQGATAAYETLMEPDAAGAPSAA